jgi:hypothetical protein
LLPRSRSDRPPNLEDERFAQSKKWASLSTVLRRGIHIPYTNLLSPSDYTPSPGTKYLQGLVLPDYTSTNMHPATRFVCIMTTLHSYCRSDTERIIGAKMTWNSTSEPSKTYVSGLLGLWTAKALSYWIDLGNYRCKPPDNVEHSLLLPYYC